MQSIAALYLIAALLVPVGKSTIARAAKAGAGVMMVLAFTALNPALLPEARTQGPDGTPTQLVEKWESPDCTVSVVKDTQDPLAGISRNRQCLVSRHGNGHHRG